MLRAITFFSLLLVGQPQEPEPFPDPGSKKGLQVQMTDDALRLGVRHATFNVQLGHLWTLTPREGDHAVSEGGDLFHFRADAVAGLDARIGALSEAGAVVYLILLARATGDSERDGVVLHPDADPAMPHRLAALNANTERGRRFLRAAVGFLADRYNSSEPQRPSVWGWIVGNEVNSHWWWHNLGRAKLERVASEYERAVRIVYEQVRARRPDARVYISLEHHWQARFAAGEADQSLPGRALLDRFAAVAREGGDYPWHVAFHPYPENLFDPRVWEDESALPGPDSPRVTFKNLEVLTEYLGREELTWDGRPRRVICSEQGFHATDGPDGARDQAAGFAWSWRKVAGLDGVDALILHRHVDHSAEFGLNLGLWTREPGSVATPDRPRPIYELFRLCDTEGGGAALDAALKAAGAPSPGG
ncbi:MAG: DUF5722 domain-containing protein [Planctomycetota bacterium]|jgi:hypothetical protein|nr:DUF5722 domain-containing protein [Planctomycetota bacterium]MDP6763801.1 DUF5722 domain-containing protein [Planctomycetota bacterium]MDP6989667.1 DUF5722 domain-containing protein [Planctomycetota bacterium]